MRNSRAAVFVTICIGAQIVLAVAVFLSGFWCLSDDDFTKMRLAAQWAKDLSFAPDRTWLPMEFWPIGVLSWLIGDVYVASVLLNGMSSILASVFLFLLASTVFDEKTARWSLVLVVLFPWQVWTTISGQTEALFQALFIATAYSLLRWSNTGKAFWLGTAAAACFFLASLRYQGWIVAAMLTVYLAFVRLLPLHPRPTWKQMAWFLSVAWAFPALWLGYNAFVHGSIAYWSPPDDAAILGETLPLWLRSARFPVYLILVSPLLSPFLLLGLRALWSVSLPQRILYGLFSYGYIAALASYACLSTTVSYNYEQRYVLPSYLLMVPCAVLFLFRLRLRPLWPAAFILLVCLWEVFSCFRVERSYRNEDQMAKYLSGLSKRGCLPEAGNVMVYVPNLNQVPRMFGYSAVIVFSREFDRILGRTKAERDDFEDAVGKNDRLFQQYLERKSISMVLTNGPDAIKRMSSVWSYAGSIAGYKIFLCKGSKELPVCPPPPSEETVEQRWNNGVQLRGVTFPDAGGFHRYFLPRWRLPAPLLGRVRAQWQFVPVKRIAPEVRCESLIGNGLQVDRSKSTVEVIDHQTIADLLRDQGGGRYDMFVTIVDDRDNPIPLAKGDPGSNGVFRTKVATVDLLYAKRPLLRNVVLGKDRNYGLALRVLLTLVN